MVRAPQHEPSSARSRPRQARSVKRPAPRARPLQPVPIRHPWEVSQALSKRSGRHRSRAEAATEESSRATDRRHRLVPRRASRAARREVRAMKTSIAAFTLSSRSRPAQRPPMSTTNRPSASEHELRLVVGRVARRMQTPTVRSRQKRARPRSRPCKRSRQAKLPARSRPDGCKSAPRPLRACGTRRAGPRALRGGEHPHPAGARARRQRSISDAAPVARGGDTASVAGHRSGSGCFARGARRLGARITASSASGCDRDTNPRATSHPAFVSGDFRSVACSCSRRACPKAKLRRPRRCSPSTTRLFQRS